MANDRASGPTPAPRVTTPEQVVAFLGDQLERQGRHPTAGLPVDLHPLLDAVSGEKRVHVHEIIESCWKSYGWIETSGGMGFNFALTPLGLDVYTDPRSETKGKARTETAHRLGNGRRAMVRPTA